MKVYLIGYMASGKTRLGCDLAEATGLQFVDLDDLFEERYRISIVDFFDKYGEEAFRNIEKEILRETASLDQVIISTGGGTPCYFDNMSFMMSNGYCVYIRLTADQLLERLRSVKKKRPLLKDLGPDEIGGFVKEQLEEREPYYLLAHYTVEGPEVEREDLVKVINEVRSRSHPS
ncbi:MAG TPA: shikimate kinase [Bacteroidales bacterium]|nr:shikimate kinase [Bacteroidales bacterium]